MKKLTKIDPILQEVQKWPVTLGVFFPLWISDCIKQVKLFIKANKFHEIIKSDRTMVSPSAEDNEIAEYLIQEQVVMEFRKTFFGFYQGKDSAYA